MAYVLQTLPARFAKAAIQPSAMQFKSYLQSLLLEITFQPAGYSLWQGTASTPLSHYLFQIRFNYKILKIKCQEGLVFLLALWINPVIL